MTTPSARSLAPFPQLATLLLVTLLLGACGSSAGPGSSTAASTPAAAEQACQQVSGALSDGPDPDADPVGYAEAQVLPLRQIHTQDQALKAAIGGLADAYQSFFTSNGKSSIQARTGASSRRDLSRR